VGSEDVVIDSVQSLDEEDFGRHKINTAKRGIYLPDNFKQTINEFRQSKLYCFTFFLYVCLELALGVKFVEFCAIINRRSLVDSEEQYPSDCADFAKKTC